MFAISSAMLEATVVLGNLGLKGVLIIQLMYFNGYIRNDYSQVSVLPTIDILVC